MCMHGNSERRNSIKHLICRFAKLSHAMGMHPTWSESQQSPTAKTDKRLKLLLQILCTSIRQNLKFVGTSDQRVKAQNHLSFLKRITNPTSQYSPELGHIQSIVGSFLTLEGIYYLASLKGLSYEKRPLTTLPSCTIITKYLANSMK